jgi:hypothetical protein
VRDSDNEEKMAVVKDYVCYGERVVKDFGLELKKNSRHV